ncbi:PAAR domain-containing protein [Niabella sp. 22666]|uniref:PAAR domain-containing protein n=1 Tax=Niabella sp. 22666 TaxID=3453954 RepID=UPI003F82F7BC
MGQPAARVGDMHVCPLINGLVPHVGGPVLPAGVPTVLIQGVPAATSGTMCTCVGPPDAITMGSGTVLIGGMPAARMGDMTAHGGSIVLGCFTVLIGDAGSGGGGGAGGAGGSGGVPKGVGVIQAKKMANQEALKKAAKEGDDTAEKTEKEDFQAKFTLVDEANKPMKDVKYEIRTNDDQLHEGRTNGNGETQNLSGYTEADCRVTFLN